MTMEGGQGNCVQGKTKIGTKLAMVSSLFGIIRRIGIH